MKIRRSTLSLFCLLISIFIIYFYYQDQEMQANLAENKSQNNKPIAYIQNGRFIIYNSKGIATELLSRKAVFFKDSDVVKVESPIVHMNASGGQKITLRSEAGRYHPDQEKFLLTGKVEITQQQILDKQDSDKQKLTDQSWSLTGNEFEIDNKQHFISTKQAVTIRKDSTVIHAIGLNAWMDDKKIELLSNVRGKYVFPKN